MAIATDINATREYVLVEDRDAPPDKRTTFTFRTLTSAQRARLSDMGTSLTADGQVVLRGGAVAREAVRMGVRFDQLFDRQGRAIKMRTVREPGIGEVLTTESLDALGRYQNELSNEVMRYNRLELDTEQPDGELIAAGDEGKSGPPAGGSGTAPNDGGG